MTAQRWPLARLLAGRFPRSPAVRALDRYLGRLEWRTGVLALLALLATASTTLVLVVDSATGGALLLSRGVLVVLALLSAVVTAHLLVRRRVRDGEAGALLLLAALATAVCGVVQPDLGWQWLSASVLGAVPVVGVMHLRGWGLGALTAVAAVSTPAVFATWEPVTLLTAVVAVAMGVVSPVMVTVVWVLAQRLDRARDDAARAAVTDELTGLLNRHGLSAQAGPLVRSASRSGQDVCVVVADVDHFKAVNDTHGHLVGDRVLAAVATALRGTVREGDLLVRWGGEELAVVASASAAEVAVTAERLRAAVEAVDVDGLPRVTASLGTATVPAPVGGAGDDAATELVARLLDVADAALYEAKGAGRNCVRHGSVPAVDLRTPAGVSSASAQRTRVEP